MANALEAILDTISPILQYSYIVYDQIEISTLETNILSYGVGFIKKVKAIYTHTMANNGQECSYCIKKNQKGNFIH